MPDLLCRDDVIAFRLRAHGLGERVETDELTAAAGRCGVQDSPPGSALLALHARVDHLMPEIVDRAVAERDLMRTWAMRGAPFLVPTADASVFTTGVLPPTEAGRAQLILGVQQSLDALGLDVDEIIAATRAATVEVLPGRRLAIGPLGEEVASRIATTLPKRQREQWEAEGPYSAGQPLGEGIVHFCVRILALEQVICFAHREGRSAPFVLVDEWLDRPVPQMDPVGARAELVRRYLRCYGPSTRADFASWLGVRSGDARDWWDLVADELTEVDVGRRAWLLTEDTPRLGDSPTPQGVRLLPPRDPYTQLRDRSTILAPEHHGTVWRSIGEPGTVLVDGRIAGSWRPRKRGRRLTVTVTPFADLTRGDEERVRAEAERLGPLRGASSVDVVTVPD